MVGSADTSVQQTTYTLDCRRCGGSVQVPGGAKSFDCDACRERNFIDRCDRCGGVDLVATTRWQKPAAWSCSWCLHQNWRSGLRALRPKLASAAEAWAALEKHGLTGDDPDACLLGGFICAGGSGDCPPLNTVCSIAGVIAGVLVVAEIGATGSSLLRYADLLEIELGGHGVINTGRNYAGGGRGVTGTLTGMAVASMLSNASRKSVVDSFIRITARQTELTLTHPRFPPETIRTTLSIMFTRYQAAKAVPGPTAEPRPATAVDELERLTRLHAAGSLTDNEFEAARAKHIARLRDGAV